MFRYAKPKTVEEASALPLADRWRMLAGGADFDSVQGAKPIRDNVLDLCAFADLHGISQTDDHVILAARSTLTDVVRISSPAVADGS